MFGGDKNSDKALQKLVNQRLERSGGTGLKAVVANGAVTLVGKLKYETQRASIVKSMRGVAGVRNITDQLQVPKKVRPLGPTPVAPNAGLERDNLGT
jgi:osmotically-inducible protein OsmY